MEKRVLRIDSLYPVPMSAGVGPIQNLRRFLQHKEQFASRGYEYSLYTSDGLLEFYTPPSPSSSGARSSTIASWRKQVKDRLRPLIASNSSALSLRMRWRSRTMRQFVQRYLALDRQADIVVFEESGTAYHYFQLAEKPAKVVVFQHSDGKPDTMARIAMPALVDTAAWRMMQRQHAYVRERADHFIFIAEQGRKNFHECHPGIELERLSFFHNGIEDAQRVHSLITEPKYRLVTVGSVMPRKGQHIVLEALGQLSPEQRALFHYSIVGGGELLESLKEYVASHNLSECVTFTGPLPNERVAEVLAGCNIHVLMSVSEGLPISIIEAMRAGMPTISTPVAGIPEMVIPDKTGLLLDPDTDALVQVFRQMDCYDWPMMGQQARLLFESEYTVARMLTGYLNALDRVRDLERRCHD